MKIYTISTFLDWVAFYGTWGEPGVEKVFDYLKIAKIERVYWRVLDGGRTTYPSNVAPVFKGTEFTDQVLKGDGGGPLSYRSMKPTRFDKWDSLASAVRIAGTFFSTWGGRGDPSRISWSDVTAIACSSPVWTIPGPGNGKARRRVSTLENGWPSGRFRSAAWERSRAEATAGDSRSIASRRQPTRCHAGLSRRQIAAMGCVPASGATWFLNRRAGPGRQPVWCSDEGMESLRWD